MRIRGNGRVCTFPRNPPEGRRPQAKMSEFRKQIRLASVASAFRSGPLRFRKPRHLCSGQASCDSEFHAIVSVTRFAMYPHMTVGRMYRHARGLVHSDQVQIQDLQWTWPGKDFCCSSVSSRQTASTSGREEEPRVHSSFSDSHRSRLRGTSLASKPLRFRYWRTVSPFSHL